MSRWTGGGIWRRSSGFLLFLLPLFQGFGADPRRNPRKNSIVQEYVLPDFSPSSTSRTGYIRSGPNAAPVEAEGETSAKKATADGEEEQVLWMGNERFSNPELLFNPSDIGELGFCLCGRLEGRY